MRTPTPPRLRVILTLGIVFSVFSASTADAQPGGQPYPYPQPQPQQPRPAPYYGGGYGSTPSLRLLTLEEREILWRGEISSGQVIGGGLLSAWLGFGLGHAVQGRYGDVGWKFTVGEVAALGAIVTGALRASENDFRQGRHDNGGESLLIGGVIAFGVIRVWEVIDAFVGPTSYNRKYRAVRWKAYGPQAPRYGLYVTPGGSRGGGQAGLTLRF